MSENLGEDKVVFSSKVLLSIFKRHGCHGLSTLPFTDLDELAKANVLEKVVIDRDEVLVLIVYLSVTKWVLLTDKHLFISQSPQLISLLNSQIKRVDSHLSIGIEKDHSKKSEWFKIRVQALDDLEYVFEVESGPSYFAFLNVLQRIYFKNVERMRANL